MQHLQGYETAATAAAALGHHEVFVLVRPGASASASTVSAAYEEAEASVQRRPLDGAGPTLTLLNSAALDALPDEGMLSVLRMCLRLDSASHVLLWAADAPEAGGEAVTKLDSARSRNASYASARGSEYEGSRETLSSSLGDREARGYPLSRIELPRARLTFLVRGGRLCCLEEPGYCVSDRRDAQIAALVAGLPQCVLLENDEGEMLILVPAASKPLPSADRVLAVTGDAAWLAALPGPRHYSYPVHPCGCFVSSCTLASSLYLLVVRLFARQYSEAFRLAEQCVTDSELSPEEAQVVTLMALDGP